MQPHAVGYPAAISRLVLGERQAIGDRTQHQNISHDAAVPLGQAVPPSVTFQHTLSSARHHPPQCTTFLDTCETMLRSQAMVERCRQDSDGLGEALAGGRAGNARAVFRLPPVRFAPLPTGVFAQRFGIRRKPMTADSETRFVSKYDFGDLR